MLGAIYGGSVAAKSAMEDMTGGHTSDIFDTCAKQTMERIRQRLTSLHPGVKHFPISAIQTQLTQILNSNLGIIRDRSCMQSGLDALDQLLEEKIIGNYDDTCVPYENLNIESLFLLGKAILTSAYHRRESRGSHYRKDFPDRNDSTYRKTTIARYDGNEISVIFEDIPEKRSI